MPLIDSYVTLAHTIEAKLVASKELLGIKRVYYGDQERIPETPSVCVEPGGKTRELNGMPRRTEVTMVCFIFVYHYRLASPEDIREENDELAETIEAFLHTDAQLRVATVPTVIDSMVRGVESGISNKGRNSLFRASRLTFEARSQVLLPSNAL